MKAVRAVEFKATFKADLPEITAGILESVLTEAELELQAIHEPVRIVPYDDARPAQFRTERDRLLAIAPELLAVEHIGSTAVPGLAAKPIIDIIAAVPTLAVADAIVERLCTNGYITSADFNRTLIDRRWLMRQAHGRRTHHLHLVLPGSRDWTDRICFRDALRRDPKLRASYGDLKQRLATAFSTDREAYGNAKTAFITEAILTMG